MLVVISNYCGKVDARKEYNELPGNTEWKVMDNVVDPSGSKGFKLVNSKGREKFYSGSTDEWKIDLETGKCFIY